MIRTIIAATAALMLGTVPTVATAAGCSGAHPVISTVVVSSVDAAGKMNNYHMTGTVTNAGSSSQGSSVLQSVDIVMGTEKLDTKSIAPLAAGQSATFTYTMVRAADAGKGTTTLKFSLDPSPGSDPCGGASDTFALSF